MTVTPTPEHVAGQLDLDGKPVPPPEVARPNPTRITIAVEIEIEVPAADCWPDGEPEQWTVDTLAGEIKADYPRLERFLDDWSLLDLGGRVTLHDDRGQWTWLDLR